MVLHCCGTGVAASSRPNGTDGRRCHRSHEPVGGCPAASRRFFCVRPIPITLAVGDELHAAVLLRGAEAKREGKTGAQRAECLSLHVINQVH